MKLSTFIRRAREVANMTAVHFDRETYWEIKALAHGGWGMVDITDPDIAEYIGVKWIGRPFIHMDYPAIRYDAYEHIITWFESIHYIMSGAEEVDRCREADERMLANAY